MDSLITTRQTVNFVCTYGEEEGGVLLDIALFEHHLPHVLNTTVPSSTARSKELFLLKDEGLGGGALLTNYVIKVKAQLRDRSCISLLHWL